MAVKKSSSRGANRSQRRAQVAKPKRISTKKRKSGAAKAPSHLRLVVSHAIQY